MIDVRLERQARRLHQLGPRATAELLDEIRRAHGLHNDVARRLDAYERLDPATVAALGGDRFPRRPLAVVEGGQR